MECKNSECIDYNESEQLNCMRFHDPIACPKKKVDISPKQLVLQIRELQHTNGLQRDLIIQLREKLRRTESLAQSMSRELR